MNTYDIYLNASIGDKQPVKLGFSWWGFLFTWAWLFRSGLRVRGFFLFLLFVCQFVSIILILLAGENAKFFISETVTALMFLYPLAYTFALNPLARLIIGFRGNKWRRKDLLARGYEYHETVVTTDGDTTDGDTTDGDTTDGDTTDGDTSLCKERLARKAELKIQQDDPDLQRLAHNIGLRGKKKKCSGGNSVKRGYEVFGLSQDEELRSGIKNDCHPHGDHE